MEGREDRAPDPSTDAESGYARRARSRRLLRSDRFDNGPGRAVRPKPKKPRPTAPAAA